MSVTITLYLWWLWVYLAIGVVLWLPLVWLAGRSIRSSESLWVLLCRAVKMRPLVFLAAVVVWPLAWWEELR